ncbi:MAG: hypothetical protein HY791_37870 [Deltaproteobacteria bacterium]|nr:hypothetical protein [Deltaproteobacteria bacterium]
MSRFAALLLLAGCPDYGTALCAPCSRTCPYELSCVAGRCVSESERCSEKRLCTARLGTRHVPLETLVTYDAGDHVLGRGNAGLSESQFIAVEPVGGSARVFPIQANGLFEFDVDPATEIAIRFATAPDGEKCGPFDIISVRPRSVRDSDCLACANGFRGCAYADQTQCPTSPESDECVNPTDCVAPTMEGIVRLPGPVRITTDSETKTVDVSSEALPPLALLEGTHGEQHLAKIADEFGRVTIRFKEVRGVPVLLRMIDRAGRHTHSVIFSVPDE